MQISVFSWKKTCQGRLQQSGSLKEACDYRMGPVGVDLVVVVCRFQE